MVKKTWADMGPTLEESPRNPNSSCFTLVVEAKDYDALAVRLTEAETATGATMIKMLELNDKLTAAENALFALRDWVRLHDEGLLTEFDLQEKET